MPDKKKTIPLICFAAAIAVLAWWLAAGHVIFTTTEHLVQTRDPLFGVTTSSWQKGFEPGLDIAGPIAVVLIGIGIWLWRRHSPKSAEIGA